MSETLHFDVEVDTVLADPFSQVVDVEVDEPAVAALLVTGPPGPPGPAGPSFSGVAWWYGVGEPVTVIGSKPGDYYVDTESGTIYKLGD